MDLATGAAVVSAVIAVGALIVAWLSNIASKRSADAAEESARLAAETVKEMARTYEGEKLLSQRQFLIQLWDYMTDVALIDPTKPITPDVRKAVHALELVALCCEGEMVDQKIIRRTFAHLYRKLYRQIEECGPLPGYKVSTTGKDILDQNRAAKAFMSVLEKEFQDEHKSAGLP